VRPSGGVRSGTQHAMERGPTGDARGLSRTFPGYRLIGKGACLKRKVTSIEREGRSISRPKNRTTQRRRSSGGALRGRAFFPGLGGLAGKILAASEKKSEKRKPWKGGGGGGGGGGCFWVGGGEQFRIDSGGKKSVIFCGRGGNLWQIPAREKLRHSRYGGNPLSRRTHDNRARFVGQGKRKGEGLKKKKEGSPLNMGTGCYVSPAVADHKRKVRGKKNQAQLQSSQAQ